MKRKRLAWLSWGAPQAEIVVRAAVMASRGTRAKQPNGCTCGQAGQPLNQAHLLGTRMLSNPAEAITRPAAGTVPG